MQNEYSYHSNFMHLKTKTLAKRFLEILFFYDSPIVYAVN
ncbi:hypothetical protein C943_00097 [Mariniradius saccharolyticus AK6]|uniref:Uncharacterized protein n=1 Tax=Mariniradius saccharolyticus AK6 TaxID=1239962 RepID=M7XKE0_9BACT|nr:hypothetical protein C943_00097 [Mariniradius saccharolyticus AK6]